MIPRHSCFFSDAVISKMIAWLRMSDLEAEGDYFIFFYVCHEK